MSKNRGWGLLGAWVALGALASCEQLGKMVDPSANLPEPTQVRVLVLAADLSGSARGAPEERCAQLGAQVEAEFTKEVEELHVRALGTGSPEPIALTQWRVWKRHQGVTRKQGPEQTPQAFARDLVRECQGKLRGPSASAVHRLLERSLQDADARCKGLSPEDAVCASKRVALMSDLRESERKSLVQLQREGARWRKALKEHPRIGELKLDLAGVELSICGVSDFDSQEPRNNGVIVEELWRELIFAGQDVGPFASHCPALDAPDQAGHP